MSKSRRSQRRRTGYWLVAEYTPDTLNREVILHEPLMAMIPRTSVGAKAGRRLDCELAEEPFVFSIRMGRPYDDILGLMRGTCRRPSRRRLARQ